MHTTVISDTLLIAAPGAIPSKYDFIEMCGPRINQQCLIWWLGGSKLLVIWPPPGGGVGPAEAIAGICREGALIQNVAAQTVDFTPCRQVAKIDEALVIYTNGTLNEKAVMNAVQPKLAMTNRNAITRLTNCAA